MSFIQEFKKFALRRNFMDLAIGVVIGASFGNVVTSLVNDIIMPPIGVLLSGVDFKHLAITIQAAKPDHAAVLIRYGSFITALVDFAIVAFVIFVVIKMMNCFFPHSIEEKEKTCPECALAIPTDAKKCGYCLTHLSF